jgi:hypothetical protein
MKWKTLGGGRRGCGDNARLRRAVVCSILPASPDRGMPDFRTRSRFLSHLQAKCPMGTRFANDVPHHWGRWCLLKNKGEARPGVHVCGRSQETLPPARRTFEDRYTWREAKEKVYERCSTRCEKMIESRVSTATRKGGRVGVTQFNEHMQPRPRTTAQGACRKPYIRPHLWCPPPTKMYL